MEFLTWTLNRKIIETGSLIHACVYGEHLHALKFVLEHGMTGSINQPSPLNGIYPIEWATAMPRRSSDEMIRLLLDFGANPNTAIAGGQTLLHRAAATMNASAVEILLEYGADPRQVDDMSCTPLHSLSKTAALSVVFGGPPPAYYKIANALQASGVDPAHRNAAGLLAKEYIPPAWSQSHESWAGGNMVTLNLDGNFLSGSMAMH